MAFPKKISNKISNMISQLDAFGTVCQFKYCISDASADEVTRADFDDSNWISYEGKPPFKRDQGVTWVRAKYTVPERCADIPIKGSELRVCPGVENYQPYFSPIQIYADGKLLLTETAWMDCKCPEGIVSASAVPGETHTIAVRFDFGDKSFWEPALPMIIISDAVENCSLQLKSIVEELRYAEDFKAAEAILPKAYELLEKACEAGGALPLVEAAKRCRELFEPLRAEIKKDTVYVVTHAHIDMNWFWPMEETERIIDRDFTTMTNLMEENPDFKFSQSQCATYAIEERQNPEVFKKMRKFAANGQWDITASTWVEGDINMASGESIARHALYSKRYLSEKFDQEPRIMWCPDTFGHPGSIPQILKKSGLDYYYHTRCGINVDGTPYNGFDYNRDAHHVPLYWWRGQDGTRVLSCNMVYGREFSSRGVLRLAQAMRERFSYDKSMFVFGVGDHGGGPTRRDIAWMREISGYPTIPTLKFSSTHEFYDQVVKDDPKGIPERFGEMNFVFDGCYTTHADIKYYNRRCENDLEATENICAMASLSGFEYPAKELEELWRIALFNQFHDIFDGSGVRDTYAFSDAEAEKALARLREIADSAVAHIAANAEVKAGMGTPVLAYNPTFARRDECVFIPAKGDFAATDENGGALLCQKTDEGTLVFAKDLPPMGYRMLYLKELSAAKTDSVCDNGEYYNISTNYYDIEIHKASGRITTLYDKQNDKFIVRRETIGWRLKNGCLNTLQIHYEEPTEMSSWTIGNIRNVRNLIDGAKSSIVEDGPVLKRVRFEHSFDSSAIRQDIVIYQDSARIDFETHVDWNEYGDFDRDAPMLKASFSPTVKNTHAVYEIPFGVIERVTGDYECPALRFADISDGEYGFALLNDSKHGYKCLGNQLSLTLIRSGWLPDQKSDIGAHDFTYSIYPHKGDYLAGGCIAQAAFLNNPVRTAVVGAGGKAAGSASMIAVENTGLSVCGVKVCEEGDDIIAKVYNTTDSPVKTTAHTCFAIAGVCECDFLERPLPGCIQSNETSFVAELNAREIKSYRIKRK